MKKIIIAYWMGIALNDNKEIEHKTEHDYSDEKRNEIVDIILSSGYQLMMYEIDDSLLIWIDNGRFRQR